MPAAKSSSSGGSSGSRRSGAAQGGAKSAARPRASASKSSAKKTGPAKRRSGGAAAPRSSAATGGSEGLAGLAEQLANQVIKPLDLVMITHERIQETLDDAAERGRLTRTDANDLVSELVRRGRLQTDELLADLERVLGRGRDQLESAAKRTGLTDGVERIVRTADRARRTVGVGTSFPILGYDDLTAAQVDSRLQGLTAAELRTVREYERRHANRKSVLEAVERALA